MKYYSCVLAVLTFTSGLYAQNPLGGTIKGKIVDSLDQPVQFASAVLRDVSDSAVCKTALSNDRGVFILSELKAGNYSAEIKLIGFEPVILTDLKIDDTHRSIDLGIIRPLSSAIVLKGVTIKAQMPFIERRADKIVVNLDNDITRGSSIMEVMDRLPGVRVTPEEQINLNGKSVTIFIDGKAAPFSGEAIKSVLKGMSSSNIERIELIADPSSRYDAAGSGGIINIVRKKNVREGLIGSVYGGLQQSRYTKDNGGLVLNIKNKVYNLFISADYNYNKYFIDANLVSGQLSGNVLTGSSLSQINSIRDNRTITPSVGLDLYLSKRTTLSLTVTGNAQFFNKYGYTILDELNGSKVRTGNSYFINNVKTGSLNYSPNLHVVHQIDKSKEFTIDLDYADNKSNSDQDNSDTRNDASGNFISMDNSLLEQDTKWDIYSAKTDYSQPIAGGSLELGWKSGYVVSDNENDFYNIIAGKKEEDLLRDDHFKYSENINALYLNISKKYQKFSFQWGIRAEHTWGKGEQMQNGQSFSRQYLQLFPSLAFDYKPDDKHGLNLHLNKRVGRPSYENLNPLIRIINSSNYTQGNPDLKPVISYNSSLTYSYKNDFFATFTYSLSLRDNISFTSPYSSGITIRKPVNNIHTDYFNFFMGYSRKFTSRYSGNADLSIYQQGFKSNAAGFDLNSAGFPSVNFNTYQNFNVNKKLSLQALVKYQGKFRERTRITDPNFYVIAGVRHMIFGTRGSIAVNMSDVFNTYRNHYVDNSVIIRQSWENNYDVRLLRANFSYNFGRGKIKKVNTGTGAADEKNRAVMKEN